MTLDYPHIPKSLDTITLISPVMFGSQEWGEVQSGRVHRWMPTDRPRRCSLPCRAPVARSFELVQPGPLCQHRLKADKERPPSAHLDLKAFVSGWRHLPKGLSDSTVAVFRYGLKITLMSFDW
jgi:hypothetical protein